MPSKALRLDPTSDDASPRHTPGPRPRIVSLKRLEQPLGPDTAYWIERPWRAAWSAQFEFFPDDDE